MPERMDIEITLAADPELLTGVRALMRAYFVGAGFAEARADELVLGIDEACANAVRHGCRNDPGRRFALRVLRTGESFQIELRDPGRRIPRENAEPGSAPDNLDALEPGGLGLPLMRKIFDEVDVGRRIFGGNSLVLRVRRPGAHNEEQVSSGG